MTLKPVSLKGWMGMNNRLSDRMLPTDKLRNAVNVRFADNGEVIFPGYGKTKIYSGTNVHSLYKNSATTLFVENGTLKLLNNDHTATVLRTSMGDTKCFFTSIANVTYFCNQAVTGKFDALTGICSEWGTPSPPRQPDCSVSLTGGIYAGDYRVAITWIGSEESGTGMGRRIAIPDGGGIVVDNFPVPPSFVKKVAVYVSSVNGEELYWYGDYPANVQYVHIGRLTPKGVLPTLLLMTQFGYPPRPQGTISQYQGRIYYKAGNRLYYTDIRRYGLQRANAYFTFDSDIKLILSIPPFLFVQTELGLASITGIDAEGSVPQYNLIKNYGAAANTEILAPDDQLAYGFTDYGFVQYNADGSVVELSYENNALPRFKQGCATLLEQDGTKYLLFSGTNGTQNPLADAVYNTAELARGSI
jgi:hypothetical protein